MMTLSDSKNMMVMKDFEEAKIMCKEKKLLALIVDDGMADRMIHQALFKSLGFGTRVVENGLKAVDLFRSGADIDLVLMDMEMPIMNGPQATKELRAMGVKNMIVGVSSCRMESEKQAFMDAGLDVFFPKPLTLADVIDIFKNIQKKN